MTTTKTVSDEQLASLERAAAQAGDVMMAAIAHLAVLGEIDLDDWVLERREREQLKMSQSEALAACVAAINDDGAS